MKHLQIAIIIYAVLFTSTNAELSIQDSTDLWNAFDTLSLKWDEEAKETANAILIGQKSSGYVTEDYQSFFKAYFEANLITNNLAGYLGYPTFYWGASHHEILQTAQVKPLMQIVDSILRIDNLENDIAQDSLFRNKLFKTITHLYDLGFRKESVLDTSYGVEMVKQMEEIVSSYKNIYSRDFSHSPTTKPYLASLRWQVHIFLIAGKPLSLQRKNDLITLLDLPY